MEKTSQKADGENKMYTLDGINYQTDSLDLSLIRADEKVELTSTHRASSH